MYVLEDSPREIRDLQSSSCPICQLLAASLERLRLHSLPCVTVECSTGRIWFTGGDSVNVDSGLILEDKEHPVVVDAYPKLERRVDFTTLRLWLEECTKDHRDCKVRRKSLLVALKVIDCQNMAVVPAPRGCKFAALSYVWGTPGTGQNTRFLHLPHVLPRTVQDSITATKLLGYRYLWVDRYVCSPWKTCRASADEIVH